jgi:hypothetical protein
MNDDFTHDTWRIHGMRRGMGFLGYFGIPFTYTTDGYGAVSTLYGITI